MLDHTNPNVEKIHYIDAELTGRVLKLDVKLQSLCGSGFSLFVVRMLAKPYHFGVHLPKTLCKNKDGERFSTSDLNAIVAITSYVILKMAILHVAIKTIQNRFFCVFFKKNKNLFL